MKLISFLDYYNDNIRGSLEKIDVFLKSGECEDIPPDVVTELLDLSYDEVIMLCRKNSIQKITANSFILIMSLGSSELCTYFQRFISRNLYDVYSAEDIAYIYNIPLDIVHSAMSLLQIKKVDPSDFNRLFSMIYVH